MFINSRSCWRNGQICLHTHMVHRQHYLKSNELLKMILSVKRCDIAIARNSNKWRRDIFNKKSLSFLFE